MFASLDPDGSFWMRLGQSVCFIAVMTFFTATSIKREVISPLQRVIFWSIVVVWVAPVAFATLYLLAGDYQKCLQNSETVLDHLYFSYVTFTTLGYGDIQPIGICRALSAVEAVSGYVFLGALVSAFANLPLKQ
ncbi:potassium channel family protein [Thalassococcus halodurans]|nr:potassium channel family protein [Thalassococcus halodurans]